MAFVGIFMMILSIFLGWGVFIGAFHVYSNEIQGVVDKLIKTIETNPKASLVVALNIAVLLFVIGMALMPSAG